MTYQELLDTLRTRTPSEYNKTLLKIAIEHEPKNVYDDESSLWCDGCDKEAPCWELEDLRLGVLRAYL